MISIMYLTSRHHHARGKVEHLTADIVFLLGNNTYLFILLESSVNSLSVFEIMLYISNFA